MTRPQVKDAVSPVVQDILDQLAVQEVITEKAPPVFGPVAPSVFGTGQVFSKPAEAVFAKAAERATEVFGPKTSAVFRSASTAPEVFGRTDIFGRRQPKGRKVMVVQRYLVPPPDDEPPPWGTYWYPFCELLAAYEDPHRHRNQLWDEGHCWNFDQVHENLAEACVQDELHRGECDEDGPMFAVGHEPDEEGACMSDTHIPLAMESVSLEAALKVPCEHDWFTGQEEWQEIMGPMVEIREEALENPRRWVKVPTSLQKIFKRAGVPMPLDEDDARKEIITAVESGVWETGLAAAFGDSMARHYPTHFGAHGDEVANGLRDLYAHGILQDGPDHRLIFERMHMPEEWWVDSRARYHRQITGRYLIHRITYHSALARWDIETDGYVGWRCLWMLPVNAGWELE